MVGQWRKPWHISDVNVKKLNLILKKKKILIKKSEKDPCKVCLFLPEHNMWTVALIVICKPGSYGLFNKLWLKTLWFNLYLFFLVALPISRITVKKFLVWLLVHIWKQNYNEEEFSNNVCSALSFVNGFYYILFFKKKLSRNCLFI